MDKRTALDSLRRAPEADAPPSVGFVRGWLWLRIAAVAVLLIGAAAASWWLYPRPPLVQTMLVTAEDDVSAASVLNASGHVVAQRQATVAAQVTGMVTEVTVREGDRVEKGQIVARLDDRAAQASAKAAAGELHYAKGLMAAYQALVDRYTREVQRQQALLEQGATSISTLEAAVASLEQNRGLADSYRGAVEQYGSMLRYYQTQLAYTEIRAPFAGVVTGRYANPGEMISPQAVGGFTQTGICTIVDMTSLEVEVDIGEAFLTRLKPGQRAEIAFDAYPGWRETGHIITIVPTANQQKATVMVRVAFDTLDPRILPQMSAQVWFQANGKGQQNTDGGSVAGLILVPKAAVNRDARGVFVLRVENGKVHRVSVRMAQDGNNRLRIVGGLHDGDRIAISATAPLKDGQKIRERDGEK